MNKEHLTPEEVNQILFGLAQRKLESLSQDEQLAFAKEAVPLTNLLRKVINEKIKDKHVPASLIAIVLIDLTRGFVLDYINNMLPNLG